MVELLAVLVGRVVDYSHCYGDGVLSGLTGKRGEEGARGGGAVQREWEERGEALGVSVVSRGCRGGCHRKAGGGGLRVRACYFASAYWQRLKTVALPRWAGLVQLGRLQVSGPGTGLSLSLFF